MAFEAGQRIRLQAHQEITGWVEVVMAQRAVAGWTLIVTDASGGLQKVDIDTADVPAVELLQDDGGADSRRVLAGLWTRWMEFAAANASATLLASSPLRPYVHQSNAVYGAMLPQPKLRFLLGDEPGTGKTVMAGLYLREMQRLGFVNRAIVVAPAGLVSKWQGDFLRFFGGELRRITNETVKQHGLSAPHDMWIVSLELAAANPSVQEAIRPDRAGWDVVVFDEAHRLTPTAQTFYRVGELLAKRTPRALLMTATPHRGSEWLFRHLMHLVDPEVYPDPGDDAKADFSLVKPSGVHFLRRMKEDLVDYDGKTRLFKARRAANHRVPMNSVEYAFYREALDLVDQYFPTSAAPLAARVYGKRASSSLYALTETLQRRRDAMGGQLPSVAAAEVDPHDEDPVAADEARVVAEASKAATAERRALDDLLARLQPLAAGDDMPVSKWKYLVRDSLSANGIEPGNGKQAVIFTEYADTADWLVGRLRKAGYSTERYSGRDPHVVRDEIRGKFSRHAFQIIVSTDAGNEGIDLQTAHVLVNWDIPWSLVRLEQRMGRIHRVGQRQDVFLYNLIAVGTNEGDVLQVLLDNFVTAANQLDGKVFDSLSLLGEMVDLSDERLVTLLTQTFVDADRRRKALRAVSAITAERIKSVAEQRHRQEASLASGVDVIEAVRLLNQDVLERVNPAVVEAYLRRLSDAGLLRVVKSAAGEGLLHISAPDDFPLPASLGGRQSALVATSGAALARASDGGADTSQAFALGPGESAFRDLVSRVGVELMADQLRGALVSDPTSVSDYDLFVYAAELIEGAGLAGKPRTSPWAVLIRVDDTGARQVRWELLANLLPTDVPAGPSHPANVVDAHACAERARAATVTQRQVALTRWVAHADRELRRLPSELSREVTGRAERVVLRQNLESMVAQRLDQLRQMVNVEVDGLRQVAHVKVEGAGAVPRPEEKDSELIAMRLVTRMLREQHWSVADVSREGRGYDLLATRAGQQRAVEVKGVWRSAASDGIRMTGNEVLMAAQYRSEYLLCVVDHCEDGTGTLFGHYRDPVTTFNELIRPDAVFRVPGSALSAARDEGGLA
ncbi:helicase-related protein [Micromonospora taraxaci]|uniref:helicase-related protein n=1 Tax=Micromonospora TaxID=1873 RepID=UPI0034005C76